MSDPSFSNSSPGQTAINCSAGNSTCIPAKCYTNFRPKATWTGEYGFDWMRDADFPIDPGLFGDLNFEETVGKHYIIENPGCIGAFFGATARRTLQPDGNSFEGTFTRDPVLYDSLKSEYEASDITFTGEDGATIKQNFTSYLSIYRKEAGANVMVEIQAQTIIKQPPEELRLRYDTALFDITPANLSNLGVNYGGAPHKETLKIECKSTFDTDKIIEVVSIFKKDTAGTMGEEVVGKLKVMANDKTHRKIKKIVLVAVKTPEIVSGAGERTGNTANQANLFTKFLKQALVDPAVETETLDITAETDFSTSYIDSHHIVCYKLNDRSLDYVHNYLYEKLKNSLRAADPTSEHKYDSYFKAFYLGDEAGYLNSSGNYQVLNGYSLGQFVVVTPTSNEGTGAHEFLHSLGLPHTFDGVSANARFTYEAKKTENVLDYSHQRGPTYNNARVSLWHWQWSIANGNAEAEP